MQDNNQMTITILGGFDGGLIVYEATDGENRLVFGGNLDEASSYLSGRMKGLLDQKGQPKIEHRRKPLKTIDELLREDATVQVTATVD